MNGHLLLHNKIVPQSNKLIMIQINKNILNVNKILKF